ncbi:MAG: response regulator [Deltaproteobacteria bacterium]|nr:response regulator [Deltaproteobacteria bacterium]
MADAKRRVVFVDDSATVRQVLARVLSVAGYEPIACVTWEDVQEAVEKQQPSLVLLDVQMPHISGAPMAFVLKRGYPDLKVIYYSDGEEGMLKQLTAETGADGYICKGPNYEQFLAELGAFVRGPDGG